LAVCRRLAFAFYGVGLLTTEYLLLFYKKVIIRLGTNPARVE